MQKSFGKSSIQDPSGEEPVALGCHTMDRLAVTWCIGIGIGYAFLVSFIVWIAYRCLLVYGAYRAGNYPFILTEMKTDLLISAGYFGIAAILRKAGYI